MNRLPFPQMLFEAQSLRHFPKEGRRPRIAQSLSFLPLGSAINRVPLRSFESKVVDRAIRGFPQISSLAPKVPGLSDNTLFTSDVTTW